MACNALFGVGCDGLINPPDPNRSFVLSKAEIVVRDPTVYQLLRDFDVLIGMAKVSFLFYFILFLILFIALKLESKWSRQCLNLYRQHLAVASKEQNQNWYLRYRKMEMLIELKVSETTHMYLCWAWHYTEIDVVIIIKACRQHGFFRLSSQGDRGLTTYRINNQKARSYESSSKLI